MAGRLDRNLRAVALSRLVGQRLRMLSSKPGQADLQMLRELIEAGAGARTSSPCEASATAVQVPGVCRPQPRPRQEAPDNKQGGYYWVVYPPSRTSIVPVM
jgi:hypothetical protein